ncbi:MAG: hypothetical protein L6406_12090 [Desulfobacterales bacterium]|nr:hypothetical protein [Pseudomonadota bacterium]MCG2776412.1 hypothetical protein [Desulfobacterales bacterium]
MERIDEDKAVNQKKTLFYSKGVTYFSKKAERTFFFILTIIMLIWGIFAKFGILSG